MKTIQIALFFLCTSGLCTSGLFGQTAETVAFRTLMSPANEVPAADIQASGAATVLVHVVRDAAGQITSGSVDFLVDYSFPGAVTFIGLHLHDGPAGANGPVTINSLISGAASVVDTTGRGSINRQGQIRPADAAGLATLNQLMRDPSQVYINLHTTAFPGGAVRGQLQRAETTVLSGLMSPLNEVPAITNLNASAVSTVWALGTRTPAGLLTSAQVIFDINYSFAEQVNFTGYHIHKGLAGENGPVTINSALPNPTPASATGAGNLRFTAEVPLNNAAAVETFDGLFSNPGAYYVNIHTTVFPGGAVRAQLRRTDVTRFPVTMLPSNEVPAIQDLQASAIGQLTAYTVRGSDGTAVAGAVTFDLNNRFPDRIEFTDLHIHDGLAGVNGPVRINTGLSAAASVVSDTGFGNIYRRVTVSDAAGLAALNSLLRNPENHYVNLHSTLYPGGAVRAPLAEPNANKPAVSAVLSAVNDTSMRVVAPGGLMTVFGTNLSKVSMDPGGNPVAGSVPLSINGTKLSLGGKDAPLMVVRPDHVVAQVPVDVAPGTHPLNATNANGDAAVPFSVTVAAAAPAIYFDGTGGLVVKNSDFFLVRPGNPARAGDILVIYSTGLGLTTPALATGQIVPYPPASLTAAVTVTIGGQSAPVIYSIASPGFLGLYQTAVRMPVGVPPGNARLVLSIAGASSNSVSLAVQ